MTIDLDALEKLADEATPGHHWTGDDWDLWVQFLEFYDYAPASTLPFLKNANPATIKALIAELRGARTIMTDVQRSTQGPSLDSRINAFLARNGEGEG